MSLTLFSDPILSDMERSLQRAFSPFMGGTIMTGGTMPNIGNLTLPSVHPMDVIEEPDRYKIISDAPGMTPEDIRVELMGDTLVVSGEKKVESHKKEKQGGLKVHRHERTFARFTRSFTLPEDARPEEISAKVEHGVLTVDIPKQAAEARKQEPKRIRVQGTAGGNEPAGVPTTTTAATGGTSGTASAQGTPAA